MTIIKHFVDFSKIAAHLVNVIARELSWNLDQHTAMSLLFPQAVHLII
jgi:hypothetical protein